MRKLLKLSTRFFMNAEEVEEYDTMGIEVAKDIKVDDIYVFADAITAFNKDTEGNTTVYIVGTENPWSILIPFEEFKKMVND